MITNELEIKHVIAKPLLKWVGGKTQLLNSILPLVPKKYNTYIEPFFGGGALFFALNPKSSIISDSNEELINLYTIVKTHPNELIRALKKFKYNSEDYYKVRSYDYHSLSPLERAARTIYLNRTCFNGLYRVNKKGQFNVPFGKYSNPKICDTENILAVSNAIKNTKIICADYKNVLNEYTKEGDLVFIDPPYLPISEYSDFKRYTKEQFYEEDHIELANEIIKLQERGCHVIHTNSNHPLVHELYGKFKVEVVKTKRHINSDSSKRVGEDVIVNIAPKKRMQIKKVPEILSKQVEHYPSTRYMGSKNKLLAEIWNACSKFEFETVLDLFSGSGVVSYMFKSQGKQVYSNDYMAMSAVYSKAMVENNKVKLTKEEAKKLLKASQKSDKFVAKTFKGLYFENAENVLIDNIRANIKDLKNPYKKAIALSALIRTCIKKRPRGIFTYTGNRYNDGRQDLRTTFKDHFINAVEIINKSIFDNNKKNISKRSDAMSVNLKPDLVYIDPPYYSKLSDNEYVRRYHFVEGIACDWVGVEIQEHTTTKKFKSYPTPFSSLKGASDAFDKLFNKFKDSIIVVSYSSNSLPSLDQMVALLSKYKKVEVVQIDHKYSFGNQNHKIENNKNTVKEYLFIGY